MADYALEPDELLPLIQTLESDLSRTLAELADLLASNASVDALQRNLHSLKGMAGMFARPALQQAVTRADDLCRHAEVAQAVAQAGAVMRPLEQWLVEVRVWLRSYS